MTNCAAKTTSCPPPRTKEPHRISFSSGRSERSRSNFCHRRRRYDKAPICLALFYKLLIRHDRSRCSPSMGLDRSPARQTGAGHSPLEALAGQPGTCNTRREGTGLQERKQAKLRAAADRRHDGRADGGEAAGEGDRSGAPLAPTVKRPASAGRQPMRIVSVDFSSHTAARYLGAFRRQLEPVADAGLGDHVPGLRRIVFQLMPQVAHVDPQVMGMICLVRTPDVA